MTTQASLLLAFLLVAHFLGDFTPLSTPRMQEAKLRGTPLGPIALHGLVHAVLVGIAVVAIARPMPLIALGTVAIEFWTHFGIDWLRGRLTATHPALGEPDQPVFWTALGLDQLGHVLVLLVIAWVAFL